MHWRQAMRIAADLEPAPPIRVGLHSAVGALLAQPVAALSDLPPAVAAAATGWAVRGFGPWTVHSDSPTELVDGAATLVRAGDVVPGHTHAVIPREQAVVEPASVGHESDTILVGDAVTGIPDGRPGLVHPGAGLIHTGAEAAAGDLLIKAGTAITAGTVALAAAAGVDELVIVPPATVAPIMLGTDLLQSGAPRRGRNRDIVAPLLPSWIMGSGARCLPEATGADSGRGLADQIETLGADLTVLTATAEPGVGRHVIDALSHLGAEILIDRVAARPAEEVLLAEMRDGRRLLALPREPAAAVVLLALLLTPMMAALSGRRSARIPTVMLRDGLSVDRHERACAVQIEVGELADLATVLPWSGPSGLAALGTADAIAFVDGGRGTRGDSVPVVTLPGATSPL